MKATNRLTYVDWMRGLACLLMFQTHCYDSWLGSAARKTSFFGWSQLLGTLPAPLFLFLAGISFALVTDRMRQRGVPPNSIAATTIRRGAEILALGLLFRLQEFVLGWPYSPWTDLLRVDILNTIGLSLMMMGVACRFTRRRSTSVVTACAIAALIALATPPLWTTWRPRFLPWFLESYINGVHTYGVPQHWLFPIFPWSAFAFAGLATGFLMFSPWAQKKAALAAILAGFSGAILYKLAIWLDARPVQIYAVYDFWHSSPNFFLARVGVLLMILWLSFAWCQWGPAKRWISPLAQLGKTSLLVYWVHIEFVYGRFSILAKHSESIATATLGLAAVFIAMLLLSLARTNWTALRAIATGWVRRMPRVAREG